MKALREAWKDIKENFEFIIAFSFGYAITALFIRQEIVAGIGDYRPLVFLPALASVVFSPIVGALSAGIGNLIIDIINKLVIERESLSLKHLIGFIANFLGGYVSGLLGNKIEVDEKTKLFDQSMLKRYLDNTIAGMVGLGAVTGSIIGVGLFVAGYIDLHKALLVTGGITFWNSVFMISLFFVQPIYVFIAKMRKIQLMTELMRLREGEITPLEPESPIEIIKAEIKGKGAIERDWSILSFTVRNRSDKTLKFRIEMLGMDIIQPSVKFTKTLKPGEEDEITTAIYPLDSGKREVRLKIIPISKQISELEDMMKGRKYFQAKIFYEVKPEFSEKMSAIMSFIGILAIFAFMAKAIYTTITQGLIFELALATGIALAEMGLIILYYLYKKRSIVKKE